MGLGDTNPSSRANPKASFDLILLIAPFFKQVGKHDEAWMILKQIHDTNMRARGQPEKVFTVSTDQGGAWVGRH